MKIFDSLVDKILMGVAEAVSLLPKNDYLHCYTITNGNSNYLTRVLGPRVFGKRIMLHKIWRADSDKEMHNHPWDKCFSIILTGAYIEERLDLVAEQHYEAFNIKGVPVKRLTQAITKTNRLNKEDFHRITAIQGPLWTLFIAGKRTAINGVDWGFLDGMTREVIPHQDYIARSGSLKT